MKNNVVQQRITKMANLLLKREFCVFLETKSLTEKLAHFKSPLSLCARRWW